LSRFVEGISSEERSDLDNKLIQYILLQHKVLTQLPPYSIDKVALTRYTPVLVIDDSLVDREINMTLLKEAGFNKILGAKEGQEALLTMKEYHKNGMPIGLVLCDWNMPNMSGIEFLKVVRRDQDFWSTPVYLVTSNHDKAHILTAVKSGVTGYIVKPISYQGIISKLAHFLPKERPQPETQTEPEPEPEKKAAN
jgi:two-component system chemotaxis response regulator CheY